MVVHEQLRDSHLSGPLNPLSIRQDVVAFVIVVHRYSTCRYSGKGPPPAKGRGPERQETLLDGLILTLNAVFSNADHLKSGKLIGADLHA